MLLRCRCLIVICLILGAALPGGNAARAQEDGNRIMFVTPTEASSPCIGDATHPLCAAETMMACGFAARAGAECKQVEPAGPDGTADTRLEYYITRMLFVSRNLAAKMQATRPFEYYNHTPPGYFVLLASWRHCRSGDAHCNERPWTEGFVIMGYSPRHHSWTKANFGLLDVFPPGWFDE